MADPKVRVNTEVDDTQAIKQLEAALRNLQRAAEAVGKSMSAAATGSAKYDAAMARAALSNERLATAATKTALGQQRVATEAERTAAAHARAEAATTRATQASQRLNQTQQVQVQTAVTLKDRVDKLGETLRNVTFAAGVLGTVFSKAFGLAEAGAVIEQTTASFQNFATNIAGIPDLLERLRAASQGTITDFDLMRSVLTLVAGTSSEVGARLAEASPQLLEIARAAQVLNPALGSVDYFMSSLATGIKRISPFLLDNLGLVVRARDAYARYARELGISAQELTAEQKSQAFLNETLRVGQLLIEQNAGAVASAVDPYARLRVEVEEVGNAFKVWLGEGLLPWVQLINGDYKRAIETIMQGNLDTAHSMEELLAQVQRLNEAYDVFVDSSIGFNALYGNAGLAQGVMDTATALAVQADSFEEFSAGIATFNSQAGEVFERTLLLTRQSAEAFYEQARAAAVLAHSDQGRTEAIQYYTQAQQGAMSADQARAAAIAALTDEEMEALAAAARLADQREKLLRLTQAGLISENVYRQAITGVAIATDQVALAHQRYNNLLNSTNFGPLLRGLMAAQRGMQSFARVSTGAASAFINALDGMTESVAGGGGSFVSAEEQALQKQKEWNAAFAQSFMQLLDAEKPIENWTTELLKSAAAAGAGAETLALLAAATGEYSDEQIATAFKGAAMKQAIEEITAALVDGRATTDEALAAVAGFQQQLDQGGSFKFDLQAYGIEPLREVAEGAAGGAGAAADETKNWTKELLNLAGQGNLTAGDLVILAGATGEYSDAQIKAALKTLFMTQKLEELSKQIGKRPIQDIIADLREFETKLDSDFELTLFTDEAEGAIDRVHRKIDELPTDVTIKVHVEADELPNYGGVAGATSPGLPGTGGGGQQHGGPLSPRGSVVGEVRPELVVGGQVIPRIPPGFFTAQEAFLQTMTMMMGNNMAALPSYTTTNNINRTSTVNNNNQRQIIINATPGGAGHTVRRELGAF